jgi:hypothetical protein
MERNLSVESLGISYIDDPKYREFICERRLIGCENPEKAEWLRTQLAFIKASSEASTSNRLWSGFFLREEERVFFLIDEGQGKICTGPYP